MTGKIPNWIGEATMRDVMSTTHTLELLLCVLVVHCTHSGHYSAVHNSCPQRLTTRLRIISPLPTH